jgi:hypothetical protein
MPAALTPCARNSPTASAWCAQKQHALQEGVWYNLVEQRVAGNRDLIGLMVESNLEEGNQPILADRRQLRYGVSVTDACVGWEMNERRQTPPFPLNVMSLTPSGVRCSLPVLELRWRPSTC